MKCSEYYFKPLYDLLKERLLQQEILHADETSYRILESETTKSCYRLFRQFFRVSSLDMWQAYKQLSSAAIIGCWAHVRRKFKEAMPPTSKGKSLSKQGGFIIVIGCLR